jgi:hypothetical protein
VLFVWFESDIFDVLGEHRSRLAGVKIDDRANVLHLVNDKAANVAELDPQRIGPRFEECRGYVANLAFAGNEGCPQCRRKISLGDRTYPAPPL